MKINAYGYELSLKNFLKVFFWRIFCTHKNGHFHACTGAWPSGDNFEVGVSFVCDKCKRSWVGDIKTAAPPFFRKNEDLKMNIGDKEHAINILKDTTKRVQSGSLVDFNFSREKETKELWKTGQGYTEFIPTGKETINISVTYYKEE